MSATRDKSQKTTFVYSNLYQIYRKGQAAAKDAAVNPSNDPSLLLDTVSDKPLALPSGEILKVETLAGAVPPKVEEYRPATFIGSRVQKPQAIASNPALQGLKDNLKNLNDLHARLKFMLQELEDLTKK